MHVVGYIDSQGRILTANFSLNAQLLGAANRGACLLAATDIVELWEKVASRRHAGLVLPTAITNVLPTHVLFYADILLLKLAL